jgi:hypothetical protein
MSVEIDPQKAYSEACTMLRHYSNASLTVRLASITQGFVILGAWGVALTQYKVSLMIELPIAGLIFTTLLYSFHFGYYRATEFFYIYAAQMEEELFRENYRPIDAYNRKHEEIYNTFGKRIFILNAPFALVVILFGIALIISIINLWKTD